LAEPREDKSVLAGAWISRKGLLAMVAEMNKIESAARLAMGDNDSDLAVKTVSRGVSTMAKIGFLIAAVAMTGLIAASLF
jgi:hypothetical protein